MPEEQPLDHSDDLFKIKEWLLKQLHLPQKIDNNILMKFLNTCNYSLEKTKHLIDLYFTIRSQAPEIFANRDVSHPNLKEIFKTIDLVPLPKATKENYRVFIYRLANADPDKYNFVDSLKAFFIIADVRMISENVLYDGQIPVFDMQGFSLKHLTKISLPILKKYMTYTQEAHPVKLRQIHVINASPFLDRVMAIVKPLMKSEVAAMLHFHVPDSDTLFDFIPKDLLPAEYGGNQGKLEIMKEEWMQKVDSYRDYFLDDEKWTLDESKRPLKNNNRKQHFSMQGSFRSLSID